MCQPRDCRYKEQSSGRADYSGLISLVYRQHLPGATTLHHVCRVNCANMMGSTMPCTPWWGTCMHAMCMQVPPCTPSRMRDVDGTGCDEGHAMPVHACPHVSWEVCGRFLHCESHAAALHGPCMQVQCIDVSLPRTSAASPASPLPAVCSSNFLKGPAFNRSLMPRP